MHEKLESLKERLQALKDALDADIPSDESFTSQGGWSAPSLSFSDLVGAVEEIEDIIELHGGDDEPREIPIIDKMIVRMTFLETTTVPSIWGNPAVGAQAFLLSLYSMRRHLERILNVDPRHTVTEELRSIRRRLRAAEATLKGVEPGLNQINVMAATIERAYNAADQLPTDLEALSEARQRINGLAQEAAKDRNR